MADRLLSQADVDELVSSLSRKEPARPAAPRPTENVQPAAPPAAPRPVENIRPAAAAPVPRAPGAPVAKTAPFPAATPKPWLPNRPEPSPVRAPEPSAGAEAKIAEISRQLSQLNATMLRLELLERKVAGLEASLARNTGNSVHAQQIQQLNERLNKIALNLKDTPGYGIRSHFGCDKCQDQGHVAVMFRCTKCGHERWYGWWPDKADG